MRSCKDVPTQFLPYLVSYVNNIILIYKICIYIFSFSLHSFSSVSVKEVLKLLCILTVCTVKHNSDAVDKIFSVVFHTKFVCQQHKIRHCCCGWCSSEVKFSYELAVRTIAAFKHNSHMLVHVLNRHGTCCTNTCIYNLLQNSLKTLRSLRCSHCILRGVHSEF